MRYTEKLAARQDFEIKKKKKKRNRKPVKGINSDVMSAFNYYFIEISL